ncbi:hypothetical protein CIB95_02185 [Lottiidibacillus patelloidae]|uniref:Probable membrane transporter protein n=1 Tax=Lottiidibacillus patelloidae TaxID=2670334 RepID=A0A263BXK8_9BACI|nr:sulfite exporter TauE/SafE family protein [Lottiidibacillus patelloidae]OZM58400.1 hypothetical protein CIB95_02185 [Lottiidibacillus patelloidae]
MTIFLFFLGIVTSFVGTITGGGGLISLPLLLFFGLPIHSAIATNKFSNTFHSLLSLATLVRRKKIDLKPLLPLIPLFLFGGATGAAISSLLSSSILTLLAIVLLITALLLSFRKQNKDSWSTNVVNNVPKKAMPLQFLISLYDGMFGPGSGTLQLHLYYQLRFTYIKAIGIARLQTFLSCLGAAIIFFLHGHLMWEIALPYAVGGLIGSQIALVTAEKVPSQKLKVALNIMTIFLIIQLIMKYF